VAGVGLTFVYGLVLGELCRRAGGLMAPFITHVFTDLVIVTIVRAGTHVTSLARVASWPLASVVPIEAMRRTAYS